MDDRHDPMHRALSRAFLPAGQWLDEDALRDFQAEVEPVHLKGKAVLFSRGEASDRLYIIRSGRLRAVGPDQSGQEMARDLVAGEMLGEMGVISGDPRSMTVYGVRDSELLALTKDAIEGLMAKHPRLLTGVLDTVIGRLRGAPPTERCPGACFALAVVPVGGGPLPPDFSRQIAEAMSQLGSTRLLDRSTVSQALGTRGAVDSEPGSPAHEALGDWLDEQEASHRFLVYEADLNHPDWTKRCLRQADHVLLVATADSAPEPSESERALIWRGYGPTSARRSLVLCHRDSSRRPTGTARWFAGRDLQRHFHLRLDRPADFGRIARTLGERGIGLVLGGGGARGFSQVGVIRALRECGIPIDLVGGTSMGAIVAAACAMDWDIPTMAALGREAFVDSKAFREYTLPFISILGGRRLERVTRKIFGEVQIEDLWIPQFSVSCNLTANQPVVHRQGPLWRAVRASGSLPGVLAPMIEAGELLVDGGVLNNLPGDVMRSLSGGPIVVVDVTPEHDVRARCETVPSAWRLLRNRLFSREDSGMPGIVDILMRATTLTSTRMADEVRRNAELYLHPPVAEFGMLEFEAIDRIVAIGYEHTMKRIEESGGTERVLHAMANGGCREAAG